MLKRVVNLTLTSLFAFSLSLTALFISSKPVLASAPYEASDVLGQTSFNEGSPDNVPTYYYEDIALDPVNHRLFTSEYYSRVFAYNLSEDNTLQSNVPDAIIGQDSLSGEEPNKKGISSIGFDYPTAVALDSVNHRLFVADKGNNYRVLVHNLDSQNKLIDQNADYVIGKSNFQQGGSYGAQAFATNGPNCLAYDQNHNRLFVCDTDRHRIMVFDVSSITNGEDAINVLGQTDFTSDSWTSPTVSKIYYASGLSYDETNDRLFVSDSTQNRIMVFDVSSITNGENAINVLGQADFTSGGSDTNAKGFNIAGPLAINQDTQQLFASDLLNNRVLVFNIGSLSNNMDASYVLGQADFTSGGSDTNAKGFNLTALNNGDSSGVAITEDGQTLYVADTANNRVLEFNASSLSNNMDASEVLGQVDQSNQPSFTLSATNSANAFNDTLNYPAGLALDTVNHRLFVSDSGNHRVLIYNLSSTNELLNTDADYVLGQPDFTSSAVQISVSGSRLYSPDGLDYDPTTNRLYVADNQNYRVLVFDVASITNGESAINVLGQPDLVSRLTFDSLAGQITPKDVSIDPVSERLYVSDSGRVLVFDAADIDNGDNPINVIGQPDFTSSDINAGPINLNSNHNCSDVGTEEFLGCWYDEQDMTNLVHKTAQANINYNWGFETPFDDMDPDYFSATWKGNFTFSADTYTFKVWNDDGVRVYVDGDLVVDDWNNGDHYNEENVVITAGVHEVVVEYYEFNWTASIAVDWCDSGDVCHNGVNQYGLYGPSSLLVNPDTGMLYVSDGYNNRILEFDTNSLTNHPAATHVLGQPDFTSGDYGESSSELYYPWGLSLDNINDRLYVADYYNYRLMRFDINTDTMSNGEAGEDIASAGGVVSFSFESDGISPTLDLEHHRLFVSDTSNCRILVFNLDSNNNLTDKSPDNVIGQENFNSTDCDSDANSLDYPGSLAYDPVNDRLFVADLYDNCRVMVFDVANITNGEDAVNVLGSSDINSSGDCDVTQNNFGGSHYYGGVAYDPTTERLYVDDSAYNYRLLIFDLSGGITDGMNASWVLGASVFDDYGGANANASEFYSSYGGGLLIDSDNQRLFFKSYDQDRVLVFDVNEITNGEDAINVLGQPDFDSTSSGELRNEMYGPEGLGYDPVQQLLFVAMYGSTKINVFDVNEITNGEDAIAVLGAPDLDSYGNGGVSQTEVYPYDHAEIAYDSINRRLYLGDDGNARVLIFDFINLTSTNPSAATTGSSYSATLASGFQGDLSWNVDSGSLPPGLSLTTDGKLTGTPTVAGAYTFSLTATDDNGAVGSYHDTQSYNFTVAQGSSGSPDSGSSGSGSTGSTPKKTTTSSTSASDTTDDSDSADTTVNLNTFSDFFTSLGKTLTSLKVGQVLSFCTNTTSSYLTCSPTNSDGTANPNHHTITIKSIDTTNNTVTITIASTPTDYTLTLNQPKSIDSDQDNQNDITITLSSLDTTDPNHPTATITFKNLSTTNTPTTEQTETTDTTSNNTSYTWLLWVLGAGGVVAVVLILVARRRDKDTNSNDYINPAGY